jgi:enoyl-CoA hydratase/carnithine racemase
MSLVLMEPHGNVALLRLNNGVTNAINPDLISELADHLEKARRDYRGLVLAGGDKFFSIGFDLPVLLGLERVAMTDFFNGFNKLAFDLFTLDQPTAAAMVGHTIAGGNILALTTDYRFAAQGKKQIGLNEIKLGIPVPCLADLILRQLVGDRVATEMIFSGEFKTMSEAQETGLVDDTFLAEALEEQAILKISELSAYDPNAFGCVKANRVEQVRTKYQQVYEARNQMFIDSWFNEAVQEKLERAAKQF